MLGAQCAWDPSLPLGETPARSAAVRVDKMKLVAPHAISSVADKEFPNIYRDPSSPKLRRD